MKKKFVVGSAVASTLTASTLTAGLALANQFRNHKQKEQLFVCMLY